MLTINKRVQVIDRTHIREIKMTNNQDNDHNVVALMTKISHTTKNERKIFLVDHPVAAKL